MSCVAPYVKHLIVNFLGGYLAPKDSGRREVAAVAGVCSAHHVLRIPHVLGQLGHRQSPVLLHAHTIQ